MPQAAAALQTQQAPDGAPLSQKPKSREEKLAEQLQTLPRQRLLDTWKHPPTMTSFPLPKAVWLQPLFTSTLCLPFFCPILYSFFPCRWTDLLFTKSSLFPHTGELREPHAVPWEHLLPTLTVLPFLFPLEALWDKSHLQLHAHVVTDAYVDFKCTTVINTIYDNSHFQGSMT